MEKRLPQMKHWTRPSLRPTATLLGRLVVVLLVVVLLVVVCLVVVLLVVVRLVVVVLLVVVLCVVVCLVVVLLVVEVVARVVVGALIVVTTLVCVWLNFTPLTWSSNNHYQPTFHLRCNLQLPGMNSSQCCLLI